MTKSFRVLCIISLNVAAPSFAGAQSPTTFDGTYTGVSSTAGGGSTACNPFTPVPQPLTIRNGIAQFTGGFTDRGAVVFQGTVSAEGELTMRDSLADVLIGKIDPSGKATGSANVFGGSCFLSAVWEKR
jgi:hypothetical protein